jgi:hypothetical protein
MELVFLSLESPRINHESDFSGLLRLNKEHTTSLEAQNAAQNGPKKTPRSPVFSF